MPAPQATILQCSTAVPAHLLPQEEVKRALGRILGLPGDRLEALGGLFDNAMVAQRYSALRLDSFGRPRSLSETMRIYHEEAVRLGTQVAKECLARSDFDARDVDLVISVSCTGFMLPSLDAYLANALGFRPDVRRLPITELGCSGGAAALARATDFLVGYPDGKVLVVSVELPTLSFQQHDPTHANLISSALFGDGAAAALLTGGAAPGVGIVATHCHLFPQSLDALGFDLRDDGFHIVLARELPTILRSQVRDIIARWLERTGVSREQIVAFLLHPGGRKILSALEEELGLDRSVTQPSWDVLRDYGNLSSAAVLFVLRRWLDLQRPASGAYGVMGAFGPGLTTELLLLRWS